MQFCDVTDAHTVSSTVDREACPAIDGERWQKKIIYF